MPVSLQAAKLDTPDALVETGFEVQASVGEPLVSVNAIEVPDPKVLLFESKAVTEGCVVKFIPEVALLEG